MLFLQVAGVVDSVEDCSSRKIPDVQKEVEARAVARAVAAGADPAKVSIIESEVIPVACESSAAGKIPRRSPCAGADS